VAEARAVRTKCVLRCFWVGLCAWADRLKYADVTLRVERTAPGLAVVDGAALTLAQTELADS
jgi:hypothetical protein